MDTGGMAMEKAAQDSVADRSESIEKKLERRLRAPAPSAAPMMEYDGGVSGRLFGAGVDSVAAAEDVGELFRYDIVQRVDLPRRRSAMLPIITGDIAVEKVSLYNQYVLSKHPMNAVVLTNDTGLNLLSGPVTIYAGGMYAGDARLDDTTPGEERILSYAIDLKVRVLPEDTKVDSNIMSIKIVRGVLQVQRKSVYTQTYAMENTDTDDRTVIVEHGIHGNRTLKQPESYWKKTESVYRFKVPAPAGKKTAFTVVEEEVSREDVVILDAPMDSLAWFSKNAAMSAKSKDALATAIEMKDALTATQRKIADIEKSVRVIEQDQGRARENMKVLNYQDERYKQFSEKIGVQETAIEDARKGLDDLRGQEERQRLALEEYLRTLTIE
jgi:hypothetical protein